MSGLASRLYRGEANFNIVGRRKLWFQVAAGLVLVSVISLFVFGFKLGIEFEGGNEFQVPVSAGSLQQVETAVDEAVRGVAPDIGEIHAGQQIAGGSTGAVYSIRTPTLDEQQTEAVVAEVARKLNISPDAVSDSRVSPSWGGQITQNALISLIVFLAAVTTYLAFRFEWRMAAAAVASLLFDLVATAAVYALSGFEVTPNTVIGFMTILGFALYDVVVVFDKVQENTRGITGKSNETYAEATNLALNQTFMRSINTSLVALLPVGGLLFIGAGLLGAGTLKDLGLVLFIGMGVAVYSSLFFASPLLVWLKQMDPVIQNHTKRVLTRRGQLASKAAAAAAGGGDEVVEKEKAPAAPAAPKAGAKPVRAQQKPSRPGGKPARSGGGGKRR
ncbi:protein translocase subunit SecF [Allorhizocola rhizosphaerae]|uniref:protein translocase subunit SecF n=1 Tax=Allorhizocola rhizosphaerae TaxID=1872709 RepID=UPI000E3DD042|nr:protein translocase subunit SecF [Allorhizocola rhizosphaerae]